MKGISKVSAAALAALIAATGPCAFAQGYPAKPVHAVISFTPGSSTDIVGRVVMQKVSEYWGQPIVAENKGGAGGSIGSAAVARAAPELRGISQLAFRREHHERSVGEPHIVPFANAR